MRNRGDQESRNEKNRERGYRQIRRIVAQMEKQPMTSSQLAKAIHVSIDTIHIYMRRLRDETPKRVHVCGHFDNGPRLKPAPLYALGDQPDVPMTRKPYQLKAKVDVKALRIKEILAALKTPMTANQLAVKMKLSRSRTHGYLRMLRDPGGRRVFIKGWEPSEGKGDLAPLYAPGNRPDVPKPKHTRRDLYERMMQDPERTARHRAKQLADRVKRSSRKKPVTIFSPLGL